MEEEFSFPLERSPAMKIMGQFWTGALSGQILVGALLLIGVGFMGSQGFNPISIIFFLAFLLPAAVFLHVRIVRKGKKLMEEWCDMRYYPESNILQYRTGFPNTMDPEWQEVKITEKTQNIVIKGGDIGGYHLRLGTPEDLMNAVRLGLWVKLDDAKSGAEKLSKYLGGTITIDIKTEDDDTEEVKNETENQT